MNKKALSKKVLLKRIIIYSLMVVAVIVITAFVSLFTLGYRFNASDGQIQQYAMIQFNSIPSGASVFVDGVPLNIETPDKTTLKAGQHTVVLELEGYRIWSKTIEIKAGVLEWLNYALLIPESLSVESVKEYVEISDSIASPDGRYVIVQPNISLPQLSLIDISSKELKYRDIVIPATSYSDALTPEVVHKFEIKNWDEGGRYLLVNHSYNEVSEWLVIDAQDVNQTKNITAIFDITISDIGFVGTSGNVFYVLSGNDIRKLDLIAGTISRPLISRVSSFEIYNSRIISYIGKSQDQLQTIFGLYRDGDDNPYTIKVINDIDGANYSLAFSSYFNEYYLAVSDGKSVEIMSGSFPTSSDLASSMKQYAFFSCDFDIKQLSFSPSGQYLVAKSDTSFASYDLEYKELSFSTIDGTSSNFNFDWLNDNYVWSDRDGKLTIREFDGSNLHEINTALSNQAVVITGNDRYIYNFNKTPAGVYQLQRTLMRI